jgi:hypothetical protein
MLETLESMLSLAVATWLSDGLEPPLQAYKFKRKTEEQVIAAPTQIRHYYFRLSTTLTSAEVVGVGVQSLARELELVVQYPAGMAKLEDTMLWDADMLKLYLEDSANLQGDIINIRARPERPRKLDSGQVELPLYLTVIYRRRTKA